MELLEIERELAGAQGTEAMAKYDEVLTALTARVKAAMDAGLEMQEFAKCSALSEAVTVARKLLRLQLQGNQK